MSHEHEHDHDEEFEYEEHELQAGHFGWNELITSDTEAAGAFYGELFGWQTEPFKPEGMPENTPPYILFNKENEETSVGGMMMAPKPGTPPQWIPYVVVDSTDESLKKAQSLGAKVLMPATDIGGVGRIAVFQDPQGAVFGVHQLGADDEEFEEEEGEEAP